MPQPHQPSAYSPQTGHTSWKEVTIEYNGKTIHGAYKTAGRRTAKKKILVRSMRGVIKETPLSGGLTPLYLAKMLLRELAREGSV
jgi:hypothetical protein